MSILSELFYDYRVTVKRLGVQHDANGVVTGQGWSVVASDVACYKEPLTSTLAATLAGRIEGDNMFSMDLWHFPEDQDIQAGDYIRNDTLTADGAHVAEYGQYWVIRGQARAYASLGLLDLGRKVFLASKQQVGPDGAP